MKPNGVKPNGVKPNGVKLNGVKLNGVVVIWFELVDLAEVPFAFIASTLKYQPKLSACPVKSAVVPAVFIESGAFPPLSKTL